MENNAGIINHPPVPTPVPTGCPVTVHETVCVQGTVTITPHVEGGKPRYFCVGDPVIGGCSGTLMPNCSFKISQQICVQIPLTFSAAAEAVGDGIVCGSPETKGCLPPQDANEG